MIDTIIDLYKKNCENCCGNECGLEDYDKTYGGYCSYTCVSGCDMMESLYFWCLKIKEQK